MTKINLFTVFLLIATAACGDCLQIAEASVLDSKTREPIDSVLVYKKDEARTKTWTDSKGAFELNSISGGPFGCPAMIIILSRAGYQSKTVSIDSNRSRAIYLDKK